MLHFDRESCHGATKCHASSRALPPSSHFSSCGRVLTPLPGCRCASCITSNPVTVLPPKLPARPNSISLMEHQSTSLKNDIKNDIRIASDDLLKAGSGSDRTALVDGSYVRFAKSEADLSPVAVTHEYCYPAMESSSSHTRNVPTSGGQSGMFLLSHSVLPAGGMRRARPPRVQCMYCCEPFDPELGGKGRSICRDAPDRVMDYINIASCACVADTMSYHCFADDEGEYEPACVCSPSLSCRSVVKWTVVVLMSLILPCLCCFWPLIGCRRCAMHCGYCVPKHRAASFSS